MATSATTRTRKKTRQTGRTGKQIGLSRRNEDKREFTVIIEQDEEGYFVAEVPELRGCYTQARTMDELVVRIREVILLCLDEQKTAEPTLRFIGVHRIIV